MSLFSSSLELERRLRLLGAMPELLADAFEQLEHFNERFRNERYMLMGASQIDKDDLTETLAQATRTDSCPLVFVDKASCAQAAREAQYCTYLMARQHSVRSLLETPDHRRFAGAKDRDDRRAMIDVISGAIGTTRLTLALDNTFGNSMSSVIKHDIVSIWTAYFMAFVPKSARGDSSLKLCDERGVKWLGKLVGYLTKVLPIIRLNQSPGSWIVFTA